MAEAVISYPGAKWRFYPHMKPYFPKDMKVFIEPFLGGGSVSLSVADDPDFTKLERMIAGDLAPEVYSMWIGIRDNADDVIDGVINLWKERCPVHYEYRNVRIDTSSEEYKKIEIETAKFWDWSQKVDTSNMSTVERAVRMYIVNKISFSGMGDSGSLSMDRTMQFILHLLDRIKNAQPLLKRMEIYNIGYDKTMEYSYERPKDTFVFLDPPYWKQEVSGLYGRKGDTHKGFPHEKFGDDTKKLKCKWFVTYDDSIYVRKMFSGKCSDNTTIYTLPFVIPGGYTMALKGSENALAGEELFIANYDIVGDTEEDICDLL